MSSLPLGVPQVLDPGEACEESLRRLGTDHIALYQLHHVDRRAPWDEIWEAMDVLRTQARGAGACGAGAGGAANQ